MSNPSNPLPLPDVSTSLRLASLVVHCEELLSPTGHDFDREAVRGIIQDPHITAWIQSIDPVFLPVKR